MDYFQDHGIKRPINKSNPIGNINVDEFMELNPTAARAYNTFESILNSNRRNPHELVILESLLSQIAEEATATDNKNPPAAKDFISNLPTLVDVLDKACNVCLDNLNRKESTVLPCNPKHYFHRECLVPWLELHNSCPCCRLFYLTKIWVSDRWRWIRKKEESWTRCFD